MEDLATFIQSMSEKYGLLDPSHKTNTPLLPARKHSQNDSPNSHEKHFSSDPSWKCLSAFLNCHERDTNHEEITSKSPKKRHGEHEEAHKEDRNLQVSNSSERNTSFSNMKTSDYIHNASFLDELQNPSLSDDMESTAVSKVQLLDPDQEHGSSGQSSPFQEFPAEDDEEEFCKENGFVTSFDELPQKEDVRWKTSELWFRDYCSSRNTPQTFSERSVRSDTKVRSLRDEEGASSNGDVQSLQEVLTSEIDGQGHDFVSTSDCERAGLPQDFAEVLENIEKGRERALQVNEKVEKLLEESGLGCVREREGKMAEDDVFSTRVSQKEYPERPGKVFEEQVSLRVSYEDILTEHERLGQTQNDREKAGASARAAYQERGGKVFEIRVLCEEAAADAARLGQNGERARKMSEDGTWVPNREFLRAGRVSQETMLLGVSPPELLPDDAGLGQAQESAEVGSPSIKQRVSDIDEASRVLLAQLDKSRSLLSPSQEHVKRSGNTTPKFSHHYQKLSVEERGEGSHPVSPQQQQAHEKDVIIPSRHQHRKAQGEKEDHVSLDEDSTKPSRQQQKEGGGRERHVSPRKQAYDEDSVLPSQQHRKDQAGRGHYASPRQQAYDEDFIMPSRQHHTKEQEEGAHHVSPRQQAYYEDKIMPSREQHARQNSGAKQSGGDEGEALDYEFSYRGSYPNKNGKKEAIYLPREAEGMDYEDIAKSWETEWEQEVLEASDGRPSDDAKWSRINEMLSHNGFSPIRSSSPATEFEGQLYSVLAEVVTNYERREKLVQELLEESEDLRQAEDRNNLHTQQLECETDLVKQKLAASEQRAEVASEAAERNYAAVRRDCQRLESANANLVQRCRNSQLEHACRAKERALQKLQDKVREAMDREERQRSKEKEMYEKLKHKVASAQRTNGDALEPNFLQRDLKPVQIVGIYERQRALMEAEIATLRTENAQLCRDLCEKENLILSKVLGKEDSKNAFELLHRRQQLQRKEEREKDDELNSKLTVEDLEGSDHQLTLQQQELHLSNGHGGESYGEELLQQVCKLLQIDEPRNIIVRSIIPLLCKYDETMEGLLQVVDAVPRMEQFVGDVCSVIFCDGERLLPRGDDEQTPKAVPGILQTWLQKLESSEELQAFKDTIVRLVWERSEMGAPTEHAAVSCRVVASYVKNLVAVESEYLCSKTSYREAEGVVKAEPQKLLHRVIAHFQMLFEVPHLEGIMAVMNSVYIQCSEYHNFARALCSMLGLDKDAGPNTIISAVNSLLVN